jgi:hypothetical protein
MAVPKDDSEQVVTHAAEAFLDKLWRKLYTRMREMVNHHHRNHEPGGIDALILRLTELYDVYAVSPTDGQALVYQASSKHWIPGTAGTGTGSARHQAHLGLILPPSVVPPGPTNISLVTQVDDGHYTVRTVRIAADGACSGNFNVGSGSYSFGFGGFGGDYSYTNQSATWGVGSTMTIGNFTMPSDSIATWLTVDVALES